MPLTKEEEALLIGKVQRTNDEDAFRQLHNSYKKAVFGCIRAYTRGDADVEDISQIVWLKLKRSIKAFDLERPLMPWLRKVVLNEVRRYYGRQRGLLNGQGGSTYEGDESDQFDQASEKSSAAPTPEDEVIEKESAVLYLRLTMGSESPPHQLIAFGFANLLEWKPAEIEAKLSPEELQRLNDELEKGSMGLWSVSDDEVRSAYAPLRSTMSRSLNEILKDSKTRDLYERLLGRVVGATKLHEYYTESPGAKNIVSWCYSVRRRVISEAVRLGLAVRSSS